MSRILLVDDEPYVTSVLSRKLSALFAEVATASDGEEALELAKRSTPSLVVSDYQMPGMDGYELARRLRVDPATRDVPVILLTARGHLLSDEQLAQTNIRQVLAKPFGVKELTAAIRGELPGLGEAASSAA